MITYWFWYGSEIVATVRCPEGTSESDARYRALLQHDAIPLCEPPDNPGDKANKIRMATVKIYPGEF